LELRFGASRLIIIDLGSQFEAYLFDALTKLVDSKRCRTIAYHSESNGIIERWHFAVIRTNAIEMA